MHPLIIGLSEIFDEGITRRFVVTGAALGIADRAFELTQPIDLDCQLSKVNREVVIHGTMRVALRLICSRCVEEFTGSFRVPLDAVYFPAQDTSSGREKALEEGESDAFSYAGHVIDLTEMVRDKVFLSVPLQPLCTVRCEGLCPHCGVNWNVTTCRCVQEALGSPFQLLKELRF
ncbi:MAG: DUF177 domain-containing protein [Nitrospinae bacterium]|nr:DUF177 domain-containing protein [Nitrospinota bacterium]